MVATVAEVVLLTKMTRFRVLMLEMEVMVVAAVVCARAVMREVGVMLVMAAQVGSVDVACIRWRRTRTPLP